MISMTTTMTQLLINPRGEAGKLARVRPDHLHQLRHLVAKLVMVANGHVYDHCDDDDDDDDHHEGEDRESCEGHEGDGCEREGNEGEGCEGEDCEGEDHEGEVGEDHLSIDGAEP